MRRIAFIAAAAVVLAACGDGGADGGDPRPNASATSTSAAAAQATPPTVASPAPSPGARPADLVSVLDGDSLEIELDGTIEEVRLEGVNTPEREECWSDEAGAATSDLVAGADLVFDPAERDQYGRLVGFLWANGDLVNLRLLEAGAALALSFDHAHTGVFFAAEEVAFSSGVGLWGRDACGPPTEAVVAVSRVEPDAPGRDDENPNGEWVEIVNDGPDADLTGWVLRDESSIHRYVFPDGFVLGSGDRVTIRSGWGDDGGGALYWGAGSVWSNGGDTVLLLDPNGNVVDRYRY